MIISDDTVQKSLVYLAETDERLGQLKGRVKALEYQLKTVKAQTYLDSKGTVDERKSTAEITEDVIGMNIELSNAITELETIIAKRKTRELGIEVWRSVNANRRHGNL
jgi:hypothetical protein